MTVKVCLVLDNPLRDLDGLILLAWQLAARGAEAYLIGMYEQAADVAQIGADVVVANYVRANNRDLLAAYRRRGLRTVVLDTEGAPGNSSDMLADSVRRQRASNLVDEYLVWGSDQRATFVRSGAMPANRVHATGCPRFDFCADPWRRTLDCPQGVEPGYVLVNTNFPIVHPRFSGSVAHEVAGAVAVGYEAGFVDRYVVEARRAHAAMLECVAALSRRLPNVRFVVRPHPFECAEPYRRLESAGNVHVRQDGTAIQWLHYAAALVHLNCSTALEAVMLDREPLCPEWINSEDLYLDGPTRVSRRTPNLSALAESLEALAVGHSLGRDPSLDAARTDLIERLYLAADGRAAARAAERILAAEEAPSAADPAPAPSLRGRATFALNTMLGYRAAETVRAFAGGGRAARRAAKAFRIETVRGLVSRLDHVAGVSRSTDVALVAGWRGSGRAVRVS